MDVREADEAIEYTPREATFSVDGLAPIAAGACYGRPMCAKAAMIQGIPVAASVAATARSRFGVRWKVIDIVMDSDTPSGSASSPRLSTLAGVGRAGCRLLRWFGGCPLMPGPHHGVSY